MPSGKCILRYHYNEIPLHTYENGQDPEHWQHQMLMRMQSNKTLIHCLWECKMVQPLWKTVWQFLTKLNILLPNNPAIICFVIYANELQIYVHTKTCTQRFIAALLINAKIWEQPRYFSVGEWINCGTSRQQNIIQWKQTNDKKKKDQLSSHEKIRTLNAYY